MLINNFISCHVLLGILTPLLEVTDRAIMHHAMLISTIISEGCTR